MTAQRGSSLMELMVAVSIVGILAALAIPSYQNYRLKTNRPIGIGCVLEAQRRIETTYQHSNGYPSDLSGAGYGSASPSCGDQGLYTLALSLPNTSACPKANCYQVVATAVGSQVKDGNLRLTYNASTLDPNSRNTKEHLPAGTSTWIASWDFQPGH